MDDEIIAVISSRGIISFTGANYFMGALLDASKALETIVRNHEFKPVAKAQAESKAEG